MNKKAIIWESVADVFLGGLILFVGITLFLFLEGIQEERIDLYIAQKMEGLNDVESFVTLLDTDYQGMNIKDSVTTAVLAEQDNSVTAINDKIFVEDSMDDLLAQIYGSKVCWILYKDSKKWIKKNTCKTNEDFLDSTVIMPMPGGNTIELRLEVKGYAK